MKSNEEKAKEAIDIAERKISENDYNGAKKFIDKAQSLYPNLDGLKQVLMMIDVYISATNKINGEADWYGILQVDPLANDEAVKKQYKKLALLLHPDKNRFNGAEGAFKLVLQAWELLSNKAKRTSYDLKRKSKQVKRKKSRMQDPPKYKYKYKYGYKSGSSSESESEPEPEPEPKHDYEDSWKPENVFTFWTVCKNNKCNTHCRFVESGYLNKTMRCPNCGQDFVATKIIPEMVNGKPVYSFSAYFQQPSKGTSDASSSSTTSPSNSTDQEQERESEEKFFPSAAAARGDDANDARRLIEEMMTENANFFANLESKRFFNL